jgi:predicted dehydrogenase
MSDTKRSKSVAGARCGVAFVGAGGMAREHLKAFRDVPGVELRGILGRTRHRADILAREYGIPAVCDSVAELYDRTGADLVVVAVPVLATREACLACFDHPWTVLAEKPAGYNVAEAEAIAHAAEALGRNAYVALNRRHYGSTRRVLDDLSRQPGPRLIKVQDQQDPAAALRAGHPAPVVDNWMYANSIHVVDYLRLLGRGRITDVEPVLRWNPAQPRYVAARIGFDSGDAGLYEGIWEGPGPWAVTVNTPAKRWEMRPLERAAFQLAGKRALEQTEEDDWDLRFKPGFRRQAELAVDAALGRPTELPTLKDALETMRLVQAIFA